MVIVLSRVAIIGSMLCFARCCIHSPLYGKNHRKERTEGWENIRPINGLVAIPVDPNDDGLNNDRKQNSVNSPFDSDRF